jgi:TolA-binding protein
MAIRINLLAESQALEELRRRDPVKRAIWVGVLLVVLVLLWSSSIQVKAMLAKGELGRLEVEIGAKSNAYYLVQQNEQKLREVQQKLGNLRQLATNRFLNGTVLNALQQAAVEDVQLMRFRAEQSYMFTEAVKAKTNADERVTAARPATVTEKIVITLDARDGGANPGDQIDKFQKSLEQSTYFQAALSKTNGVRLINYLPPQAGPDGKPFVLFSLECRYPEKTR